MKTLSSNKINKDTTFTILNDIQFFPGDSLKYLYKELDKLKKYPTDYVLILGDIICDADLDFDSYNDIIIFIHDLIDVCKKNNIKIYYFW